MRKASLIKVGVAGAVTLALGAGLALPANADPQAQPNDAVIVGSDTVQFLGDFLADGQSAIAGTTGLTAASAFNSTNKFRLYNYDATVDAKGRTATVAGTGTKFAVVLRAGAAPVHLPNGSGDGYNNFYQDTGNQIDFVRGSRLPNAGDITNIHSVSKSYHSWRIASDGMQIAVANPATNAPAAGLTKAQLTAIYQASPSITSWHGIDPSLSTDLIVPMLPQDGSGTHDDFLTDILGSKTTPANSHLVRTEEHDPSPLTNAGFASKILASGGVDLHTTDASGLEQFSWQGGTVTAADAISPFSLGRYNLIQTGYFDVGNAYGTGTGDPAWKNAIQLLPDTGYFFQRYFYLTALQSAFQSSSGWQPGSSINKVNTILNWYKKATNASAFADAGVSFNLPASAGGGAAFKDCGQDVTSC